MIMSGPTCVYNVMRKPAAFCICGNKGPDQLCDNRAANQRLCFRYVDSLIPLIPKSENLILGCKSLVSVVPGRKPRRQVLSPRGSTRLSELMTRETLIIYPEKLKMLV